MMRTLHALPKTLALVLIASLVALPSAAQFDPGIFDYDGDGSVDPTANARHVEYWAPEDLPMPWVLNETGYPALDANLVFQEILAGFDAWAEIPGISFSHDFGGTVPQAAGDATDGLNLVSFGDPSFSALYGNAVIAVGITTSLDSPGTYNGQTVRAGQIVDADMLFNPTRSFNTTGVGGSDLRGVAVHEVGHLIGVSHSGRESATMFPALPRGLAARSLSDDDILAGFMAYPQPAALAAATDLSGQLLNGLDLAPIGGAGIFLISTASEDTVASTFTLPDGSYNLIGMPEGEYFLSAHPLDGSAAIKGLTAAYINAIVEASAGELFVPESWDIAESATDNSLDRSPIQLVGGAAQSLDIITNVDGIAPSILRTVPMAGQTGIPIDAVVAIDLDEGIDFSSTTGRFHLDRIDAAGNPLEGRAGRLNYLGREFVLIFNIDGSLDYSSDYRVTLDAGITDLFGNATASESIWEFRTQDPPAAEITYLSPARGAPGSTLLISGVGLDIGGVSQAITIGGVEATVLGTTGRSITVLVPDLEAGDADLVVQTTSGPLPAELFTVLPERGPVSGHLELRVALGANPIEAAVHPSASFAFISTDDGLTAVNIDQTSTNYGTVVSAIPVAGGSDAVALSPDGERAYAVAREAGEIQVHDVEFTDPSNLPPNFNSVIDVLATGGEPLGAVLDAAGRRLWVSMADGTIQGWDIDRTVLASATQLSPTYHRLVAEIPAPAGAGLEGSLALSPAREELYALGGGGTLYAYATDGAHDLLGQTSTQADPQDIAVDPSGSLAYITHRSGRVSVVELSTRVLLTSIEVGGSPRGIAAMPDAQRIFFADRLKDEARSIGTIPGRPGYRDAESSVATELNPVDIVPLPDSAGILVIEQGSGSLALYSTARGIRMRAISPNRLSPFGGLVNITADPPFGTPVFDPGTSHSLRLPDGSEVPLSFDTRNTFRASVPPGTPAGPLQIVETNSQLGSSRLPLGGTVQRPELSGTYLGQQFRGLGVEEGYDFGTADGGDTFVQVNEISADGQLGFFATNGFNIKVLDLRPESPTFEQVLTTLPTNFPVRAMVHDPGAEKLLVVYGGSDTIQQIVQFDVDLSSGTFGQFEATVGYFNFPPTPPDIRDLFLSPIAGVLAAPTASGSLYWIRYLPDRDIYDFQTEIALPLAFNNLSYTNGAFGPDGLYFVGLYQAGQGGGLWVVDLDPGSPSFGTTLTTLPLSSTPKGIALRPDMHRAYLFTQNIVGLDDMVLHEVDFSSPGAPAFGDSIVVGAIASTPYGNTTLAPNLQTLVHETGDQVLYFDILSGGTTIDPQYNIFSLLSTNWPRGMVFTPDASAGYLAPDRDWEMFKLYSSSATGTASIQILSGSDQTGQVGERLPAPIRARVISGDGSPKSRTSVTITVLDNGGTLGNGSSSQVIQTDEQGYFSFQWTLGATASPPQHQVLLREVDAGEVSVFATALADPASVPLSLVQTLPAANATNISLRSAVALTFNQAVDPASVASSTLALRIQGAATPLAVAYGFANQGRTVSMTPVRPLPASATILLEVGALQAVAGSSLENPAITSFSTVPPPALALRSISPTAGSVGSTVVLSGAAFDEIAANNRIFFGGASTLASGLTVGGLRVTVPAGATTGSVRVERGGQISGTVAFQVLVPQNQPVEEVLGTFESGITLNSLAVLPNGSKAYSVDTANDVLLPLDLVTLAPQSAIPVGNEPVSVVADPSGSHVYVANFASGTVSVVSTDSPEQFVATIPVGEGPLDLAIHPDGNSIYVVNSLGGSIDVIDTEPTSATFHSVTNRVNTGSTSKGAVVSPDGGVLYVGTEEGFVIIDLSPENFGATSRISTGSSTKGASVSPDGGLLVLVTADGEVLIVDVSPGGSNAVVSRVTTGSSTQGASVSPDGGLLFLLQEDSDEILVATLTVTGSFAAQEGLLGGLTVEVNIVSSISVGEDPTAIAFDPSRGIVLVANGEQGQLTLFGEPQPTEVAVQLTVTPRTLNLGSNGKYVTATLELPAGMDTSEILESSLRLNGILAPVPGKSSVGDADGDGLLELTVKFSRAEFQDTMPQGESVPVNIRGTLIDGITEVLGDDAIRTIRPSIQNPTGGQTFATGQSMDILWDSSPLRQASSVRIDASFDGGEVWEMVAQSIADGGIHEWEIPGRPTDELLIAVTLFDEEGLEMGMAISPGGSAILEEAVAARVPQVQTSVEAAAGVLQWVMPGSLDAVAFHILASDNEESGFERLTLEPVVGVFVDHELQANRSRWYLLEDAETGQKHGPYKLSRVVHNALEQNVPNSFNPLTEIHFSLAQEGPTSLVVYDLRGRAVRVLVSGILRADNYQVKFDGRDKEGRELASGIYVYRLVAPGFVAAKRMVLVR